MSTGNNKKFVVKNGLISQNIEFLSPDSQQKITASMRDTGVLSFDSSNTQLFSIDTSLAGVVFSVNKADENPSVEIDDDGTIRFAEFGGHVLLGTSQNNNTDILQVNGSVDVATTLTANTLIGDGSSVTDVDAVTLSGNTASDLQSYADGAANTAYANAVSYVDNQTTDDLSEGNTNLYYLDSRVDSHLSAANGLSYSLGLISADQDISSGANVTFTKVTGLATPAGGQDAATKAYVDEIAEGLQSRPAAEVITLNNLDATYDNANSGVGATLTASSNTDWPVIDNYLITSTDFGENGVLVAGQANAAHNGRYNLIDAGSNTAPWVLQRCSVCDESDDIAGSYVFIKHGDTYAGTGWIQTVEDAATFVVGTDDITVTQFSQAGVYTANDGLILDGLDFRVDANIAGDFITYTSGVLDVESSITAVANTVVRRGSNNDIYANTFHGDGTAVTNVDAATVGGNTASDLQVYANAAADQAYSNAVSEATTLANTAYTNAVSYSDSVANAAYSNAISYTDSEIAALVNTAPTVLDTLNELAAAINDDPDFANSVAGQISTAFSNAVSEATALAGNAYSNAVSYTDSEITNLNLGTISTQDSSNVNITGGSIDISSLTSSNIAYPTTDGSNGQIIATDGSGSLSFIDLPSGVEISDTAPSNPSSADMWWDSSDGTLKIYYDDGNTQQWVDATPTLNNNFDSGFQAPIAIEPTNDVITFTESTFTLSASDYIGPDSHESTDWQISTDESFSNTVLDVTANTGDLTSFEVSNGFSTADTYYWRVRYRSSGGSISNYSEPEEFDITVSPQLGDSFRGGIYMGAITAVGQCYALIVAPNASGCAFCKWKNTATATEGADSLVDGFNNTYGILDNQDHPAGNFCATRTINGFSDWYLPAIDELEKIYNNGATASNESVIGSGEAFRSDRYWSSTCFQNANFPYRACVLHFNDGDRENLYFTCCCQTRAVRREPI